MPEVTQEAIDKWEEYRQVCAVLVQDVGLLSSVVECYPDLTKEDLIDHIKYLQKCCDELTTDKKVRERRFNAMSLIFGAAKQGLIKSTPIGDE